MFTPLLIIKKHNSYYSFLFLTQAVYFFFISLVKLTIDGLHNTVLRSATIFACVQFCRQQITELAKELEFSFQGESARICIRELLEEGDVNCQ